MPEKDRSHWVTHEQLDIPLCYIFPGTKTKKTARLYIQIACTLLDEVPKDLTQLSYEELNEYIDELERKVDQLQKK